MTKGAFSSRLKLHKQCNICSSILTRENIVILASGTVSCKGDALPVHTVMCLNCSYIFQFEIYDADLAESMYAFDKGFNFPDDIKNSVLFKKNLLKRQRFISRAIHNSAAKHGKKLSLLDVGGGLGECSSHLTTEGDIHVIDYTDDVPINDKIIKLHGDFLEHSFDRKFDFIIMNHVLEHTPRPLQFILKAHSLLNEEGTLIIEVPLELYTPLLFKKVGDWRHINYFNSFSLKNSVLKSGFIPHELLITTGHYGPRSLAVIRCIARKGASAASNFNSKRAIFDIIADCLHPVTLYHGIIRRIITG